MTCVDVTEEWRPILGTDGYYEVSNLGRFRSWKLAGRPGPNGPGRAERPELITGSLGLNGYVMIDLVAPGKKRRNATAHSLVAEAFLGPRPQGLDVCHDNGVRTDNRADNLRYDTRSANQLDRIAHGTSNRGGANGSGKLSEGEVLAIDLLADLGMTSTQLAPMFGVSARGVRRIVAGETWSWLTGRGG